MITTQLRQPFTNGLIRSNYARYNAEHCDEYNGLRPTQYGATWLKDIGAFTALTVTWPWPKVVQAGVNTLVFDAGALYVLNGADLAALAPYDPTMTTPYTPVHATTQRAFQVAEFDNIWFATNGAHFYYCHPINGSLGAQTPLLYGVAHVGNARLRVGCVAKHNGAFYASGFNPANARFTTAEFLQAFELWRAETTQEHVQETSVAKTREELSDTHVLVSRQLGGDKDWPFAAELALLGLPDSTEATAGYPLYADAIRKGQLTFVQLPNASRTLAMLPLGNMLVCYSSRGISVIDENNVAHVLSSVGVLAADTVVSAGSYHIFMDNVGQLWTIDANLKLTWLDATPTWNNDNFAALVSALATKPVTLCHDPVDNETYISNGDISYCLTQQGLCKAWRGFTSQGMDGGNTKGYYVDLTPADGLAHIITSVTDLGSPARKVVHSVELGTIGFTNVKLRVSYRRDGTSAYVVTPWLIPVGGMFMVPCVDATQFKFEIKATPSANCCIQYMNVNWYARDRRMHRGRLYNKVDKD